MVCMPVPPARLKTHLAGQLDFYASQRWPQLEEVTIHWHGGHGYLTAHLPGNEELPLCRLRYLGSPTNWGFALYQVLTVAVDDDCRVWVRR
jgi:hypothetical protein